MRARRARGTRAARCGARFFSLTPISLFNVRKKSSLPFLIYQSHAYLSLYVFLARPRTTSAPCVVERAGRRGSDQGRQRVDPLSGERLSRAESHVEEGRW